MNVTDSVADLLTRIRNASSVNFEFVTVPASNLKKAIVQVLLNEGFIKNFTVIDDNKQGIIKIHLKYDKATRKSVINGIKRISKPGLRVYHKSKSLPKVMRGLGIAVVSTSKGIMTDRDARKQKLGGEVMAYVW